MIRKKNAITSVSVITAFALLPLALDVENSYFVYFLFMAFTYLAMAQAFNLIAGYTGQVSLGLHAFFGLGAYVTAFAWQKANLGYFHPLAMLLAGLIPVILAVLVGIPLLSKLKGDYFALGTLGLGEILRVIFIQGGALTGGSMGTFLPSDDFTSMLPYYYTALFLAVMATLMVFFIIKSRLGLALIAIREDETAAAANGIEVLGFKVFAFAAGAFVLGLCGSLQAYYLFHVHPQNFFGLNWTLYPILMCVLGGSGSFTGPVVGALLLTGVFELAKIWLPDIHPIISGILIIIAILFLPDGLVRMKWQKWIVRKSKRHLGLTA
jgi:branched-chain amino acid transport system permease protein